MKILTDEQGNKFEIHPAPHGGRYVEMVEVKKEPRRIDWSRVNLDVVPVKWRKTGLIGYWASMSDRNPSPDETQCMSLITGKRIAWDDGDDCPLPEGVIIKVALHSGSIRERDATTFLWDIPNTPSRIVWFEVVGVSEGWVE